MFSSDKVPLVPRTALFGNPVRFAGSVSPDGAWLGWIAPHDGVNNIWIAPRDRPDAARLLSNQRRRGIGGFNWAYDGRHILYEIDQDGDEHHHVHAIDRETGVDRDLTPGNGRFSLALASVDVPAEIVINSNSRDPRFADLFRLDLASGDSTLLQHNDRFDGYILDRLYVPRLALRTDTSGAQTIFSHDGANWHELLVFAAEDAGVSGAAGLDHDATTLFLFDSRGRDRAALVALDLITGDTRIVYENARAEITGTLSDMTTYWPLACVVSRERSSWVVLDERVQADIDQLDAAGIGDWSVTSRSLDDRWWTIGAASDTRPGKAWLLDRQTRQLSEFYQSRPLLESAPLCSMRTATIRTRDNLELISYLTLPKNRKGADVEERPAQPLPMVLVVHGGPWSRDSFGFSPTHQWLANRGYAVLSVNFRGSLGFGKAFLAAGDGAWGAAMDDDLADAVDWAISEGIADPDRIAIMGASYGGYATLSGLTRTPERYACGIDIVGPSNLETLLEATPAWWEAMRATLYRAIGDPETEDGRALLRNRSPLHRADAIIRPLLIGQGGNDPRVKQGEADQMVEAMRAHDIPVTYLLYPDEGHGFRRPPNALSFNAVAEAFLARWLGGRCEPMTEEEFRGSSMQIVEGEEWLAQLLPQDAVKRSAHA